MSEQKNVFISHHHKDDESVDGLTELLKKNSYEVRNSSIRVDQDGKSPSDGKTKLSDKEIEELLKDKITWAGTVIVIIGVETHTRPWVNWEIEEAYKQGKNVIGVYENGLKDQVELPDALEKYSNSILGWSSSSIIDAINGKGKFENPDGTLRERNIGEHIIC